MFSKVFCIFAFGGWIQPPLDSLTSPTPFEEITLKSCSKRFKGLRSGRRKKAWKKGWPPAGRNQRQITTSENVFTGAPLSVASSSSTPSPPPLFSDARGAERGLGLVSNTSFDPVFFTRALFLFREFFFSPPFSFFLFLFSFVRWNTFPWGIVIC